MIVDLLQRGLLCVGATRERTSSAVAFSKRVSRFKSCFGMHPMLCMELWNKLGSSNIDRERKIDRYFLSLFWLKSYATEAVLAVQFDLLEDTVRLWTWYYARCLEILSEDLIVMPDVFDPTIPFPLAVDGTHCTIYEPMHDRFPMDRSYFSHKHHTSGFNYQITVSTTESRILSIHGPFPAGRNDKNMFKDSGLQQHLVSQNKRAIADGGYENVKGGGVAVPNRRYHSKLTNIYFRRNRARMERVMGFFKNFAIIAETFRVRKDRKRKHQTVFKAVGAIAALQVRDSLFKA